MNQAKVLAVVGGKPITDADVDAFIMSLGQRGAQYAQDPKGRAAILEQIINNRLFLLDASRNLYEADPAVKAELARAKESILISFAIDKAISTVRVSDADLEKYYEEHKAELAGGDTVSASHILVDTEEEANAILADIKAGTVTFEDAARKSSKCPSGAEGGSLGAFGKGQMVPEFENACFAMEVGAISEPVKTQFGYHIIRLDEKSEGKIPTLAEVKEELRAALTQEKQRAAYQSKVNQLKILYPVEKL